jgi:hypothetical protein
LERLAGFGLEQLVGPSGPFVATCPTSTSSLRTAWARRPLTISCSAVPFAPFRVIIRRLAAAIAPGRSRSNGSYFTKTSTSERRVTSVSASAHTALFVPQSSVCVSHARSTTRDGSANDARPSRQTSSRLKSSQSSSSSVSVRNIRASRQSFVKQRLQGSDVRNSRQISRNQERSEGRMGRACLVRSCAA